MGNAWPQPNRIGSGLEEVGVPAFPGYDFYQKKMAGPTSLCVPLPTGQRTGVNPQRQARKKDGGHSASVTVSRP